MHKSFVLLGFVFLISAFKCSFTESSKSKPLDTTSESPPSGTGLDVASATIAAPTKVTGPLRLVVSGGVMYGEVKTITADKVIFDSIDYGQDEPAQHNVEHTVQDGLVMDEKGEISVPIIVYVEVEGGKFPCSSMIAHDPSARFCHHLVLETDEIFTKKLATDANFRQRFGAMLGKPFDVAVKNAYFKVGDVP